jgi:hypothetical protein
LFAGERRRLFQFGTTGLPFGCCHCF